MGTESIPIPGTGPIQAGIDHTPPIESARGTWLEWVHGWIVTVDHKRLGILYILYALVFLLVAGSEALLIRIQLAVPHNTFVSPFIFNRLFTMHGTTMVFLVGMPILFGFGNYLVPLMIGARDMAFPRLNAFSFWISAFGGLLLYYSFIGGVGLAGTGSAPDVAWFAYAPLTEKAFSPGHTVDYWAIAIIVSGIGSIGTAIRSAIPLDLHHSFLPSAGAGDAVYPHRARSRRRVPHRAAAFRRNRRKELASPPGRRLHGPLPRCLLRRPHQPRHLHALVPAHERLVRRSRPCRFAQKSHAT